MKVFLTFAELLTVAGYLDRSHVVGTKWRFLYEIFKEFNAEPDGQYHVAKIVQAFCDPTQWIGRESACKQVMNTLNEGLAYGMMRI